MSADLLARSIAAGRIGIGAALVASPAVARPWMGEAVDTPGGQLAVRGLGVRDLLLGVIGMRAGADPRFLTLCSLADLVDGGATAAALDRLPGSAKGVVGLAGGALVAQLALARAGR